MGSEIKLPVLLHTDRWLCTRLQYLQWIPWSCSKPSRYLFWWYHEQAMKSRYLFLIDTSILCYRCGKCHRFMKYVQAKPSRLHCASCDETYSLPQNGNIKLYKEIKCPLDDFELVLWSTGAKGKVSKTQCFLTLVMLNIFQETWWYICILYDFSKFRWHS